MWKFGLNKSDKLILHLIYFNCFWNRLFIWFCSHFFFHFCFFFVLNSPTNNLMQNILTIKAQTKKNQTESAINLVRLEARFPNIPCLLLYDCLHDADYRKVLFFLILAFQQVQIFFFSFFWFLCRPGMIVWLRVSISSK